MKTDSRIATKSLEILDPQTSQLLEKDILISLQEVMGYGTIQCIMCVICSQFDNSVS